jgi:hypothetical protein
MATKPAFPGTPAITAGLSLTNSHGTNLADLYLASGAGQGVMLGRLRAASDDTAAVTLQFCRNVGGTDFVMGESQVPAGAGSNGAAAWKDLLADLNLGLPMTLAPGEKLRVKAKAAVTAGRKADIILEAAPL